MKVLLDTNIVLRYNNRADPRHGIISAVLEGLVRDGAELVVCAQNIVEFWATMTRPTDARGMGFTPRAARREVDALLREF